MPGGPGIGDFGAECDIDASGLALPPLGKTCRHFAIPAGNGSIQRADRDIAVFAGVAGVAAFQDAIPVLIAC
jgi:hypothetical protein